MVIEMISPMLYWKRKVALKISKSFILTPYFSRQGYVITYERLRIHILLSIYIIV
jgi:hypothetical protein